MAFISTKTMVVLSTLVLALIVCETSNGEVHELGWSDGAPNDLHYDTWSTRNKFHVGDTIVIYYSPDYDGVAQVTFENFEICNFTSPIASWSDAWPAVIQITEHGHFYFISDVPGHCEDGQKFTVYVPEPYVDESPSGNGVNPSPNGPSKPYAPASSPNTNVPAPAPTHSSSTARLSSL